MKPRHPLDYKIYYKRKLPHIQPKNTMFFITYRLNFEYPEQLIKSLHERRFFFDDLLITTPKEKQKIKIEEFNKKLFDIEDNFLTKIKSPKWLIEPEIVKIIKESLLFRNKIEYDLFCFCIMPNHVHILIKPFDNSENIPIALSHIMHNHKSFTANKCNKFLKRSGTFWYPDYYDHYIRNEKEFHNVINYILQNPVKAGLVDDWKKWENSWVDEDAISL